MKLDIARTLTTTFEGHARQTDGGVEYRLARDVQYLLGYAEWRNFTTVISKAQARASEGVPRYLAGWYSQLSYLPARSADA